jgi:hypothetical protein
VRHAGEPAWTNRCAKTSTCLMPAAHSAVVGVHTEVLKGKVDGEPEATVMLKVGGRLHLHARTLRQNHYVLDGGAKGLVVEANFLRLAAASGCFRARYRLLTARWSAYTPRCSKAK